VSLIREQKKKESIVRQMIPRRKAQELEYSAVAKERLETTRKRNKMGGGVGTLNVTEKTRNRGGVFVTPKRWGIQETRWKGRSHEATPA